VKASKTADKAADKAADRTADKAPAEAAAKAAPKASAAEAAAPEIKPPAPDKRTKPPGKPQPEGAAKAALEPAPKAATKQAATPTKALEQATDRAALPRHEKVAPQGQVTPAKAAPLPIAPVEPPKKGKTAAKPTPAEIAAGTRGGGTKQAAPKEAVAPRFDFADDVETKSKAPAKVSSKAEGKLAAVVSVTKTQKGQNKGDETEKPPPPKK
jgi:hypothetical protein